MSLKYKYLIIEEEECKYYRYYAVMFQVSFCPMLYLIFSDVKREQSAVIAYA